MAGNPDVLALLEEILDSGETPEVVCRDRPELLDEVRRRWQAFRLVDAEIEAILPEQGTVKDRETLPSQRPGFPQVPGYEVEAVLGHGGMGIVYKARHLRLNRTVALKMLLAGAYAGPQDLARFQLEAEAVAGLHHANVVQVHDVADHEGRPYLSLEFIDGGSLAQKLTGAPQPARQAAALLVTLAGAVHAAHQGGIVHRDLKPANILLTADGTPKISDFGLARRLESDAGPTQSGALLGTPSYMSPEQARGKDRAIGPAADTYALGAILYELLTGRPPFRGETPAETVLQVISQEPVPPARLNPRVPRDLETICLKCLHEEPERRYASARALAEDLDRFLSGEAIAARPDSRLERLVRGVRRRPTLAVTLTASLLLATALVGGGLWVSMERAASELARRQLDRVNREHRDQDFVARLDAIRLNRTAVVDGSFETPANTRFNKAHADQAYEAAFREVGIADTRDDPGVVAARLETSNIRGPLAAAVDDWAACAADPNRQNWLLEVVHRAGLDPTGLRHRLRDPAVRGDPAALTELAERALKEKCSARFLVLLGERLRDAGSDAVPFLTQVQQEYPDDFWINFLLGETLYRHNPGEAIRYYQAALALRPNAAVVYNNLGRALAYGGRYDEAIVRLRQALAIDPAYAHAHSNLGLALRARGRQAEALPHFEQAVRFGPQHAATHTNLGVGLVDVGRLDEAAEHFREALRLDPRQDLAHTGLGSVMEHKGLLDESYNHYQAALRIQPNSAPHHTNLGKILANRAGVGMARVPPPEEIRSAVDEAVRHFREALRLDPKHAPAHASLGGALLALGQFEEAIGPCEEALRLDPGDASAHNSLAKALVETGRTAEAIDHFRQATELKPGHAQFRCNLALALGNNGQIEEAIESYRQALRVDPNLAEAHGALGMTLVVTGSFEEAREAIRYCLNLLPPGDPRRPVLIQQVRRCERCLELQERLPAVVEGKEKLEGVRECLEFAEVCRYTNHHATATRLFAEVFATTPRLAEDLRSSRRYFAACSAVLAGCGRGEDAVKWDDAERARWREQARDWLQADLTLAAEMADGTDSDRVLVRKTMAHWLANDTLASVRGKGALAGLPGEESRRWGKLWSDADALLRRARD
jgi:eukaryotic-like serine/threonine-protein kinase